MDRKEEIRAEVKVLTAAIREKADLLSHGGLRVEHVVPIQEELNRLRIRRRKLLREDMEN